jgi:conjugal transfer pilus assembly protein TraE
MNLIWMRRDLASARRAITFLIALLVGSMLANLILAVFAVRIASRERVVVVLPIIHRRFGSSPTG